MTPLQSKLVMKQERLEEQLSLILQKVVSAVIQSVSCFRKVLVQEDTYRQLQLLLRDFANVEELLEIVVSVVAFMDIRVDHELKALRKIYDNRYRELEGQLQKQQHLFRNLRELQLRENLQLTQTQIQDLRGEVSRLSLRNFELSRSCEQGQLERQQILNKRNFELCQKDLVINVLSSIEPQKLQQSLGIVQQSDPNDTRPPTKVKQHHRRKSDQPVRSYVKDKKHSLATSSKFKK